MRSSIVWCLLCCVADQPHCVLEYVLWGTLGSCSAAAVEAVSTPGHGTGGGGAEQSDCQHVNVTSCDQGMPGACAEWDFFSGGTPTTFVVPTGSSVGSHEWQIFETGDWTARIADWQAAHTQLTNNSDLASAGAILRLSFETTYEHLPRIQIECDFTDRTAC